EVFIVKTVRADNFEFETPDIAQVFLGIEPGRRAADQDFAAAFHALERRRPEVAAGEVDYDVDAALVVAALRLAEFLDRPFGKIGVLVIDHVVGAEIRQALDFVGAARARDDFGAEHFREQHAAGADT